MNLNNNLYIQQFLAGAQGGQTYNDAAAYGVTSEPAQVADGQLYWRVIGVHHLHTRHKDEGPGNTIGHHSFFVVFQRSRKGPSVLDREAMLQTARALRAEQIAGGSRLSAYARDHQLGAPVTAEFSAGGYRARGFERGVVFAPLTRLDNLAHVPW